MTGIQSWLLLEYSDDLVRRLYQRGENPDPHRLFDQTELAGCSDQSPLLVSTAENPSIAHAFSQEPSQWPGLKLHCSESVENLLRHLRHILFIGFDQQRKGVLRYSNPRTASYFFAATQGALPVWLGPIQRLSWHGGTWRDSAVGQERWQRLENTRAADWDSHGVLDLLLLNQQQTAALQRQQGEKFVYQWWQQQPTLSFDDVWTYLEEGVANGFTSVDALTAYLDRRSIYPDIAAPSELLPGNDQSRLEYLKASLERSLMDKECQA